MSETSNIINKLNQKLISYLTEIKDLRSSNYAFQKEKIELLTVEEDLKEKINKLKIENNDLKEIVFELTQKNNELEKQTKTKSIINDEDFKSDLDFKKKIKIKPPLDYRKIEENDKNIDFDNEEANIDNDEDE
ncbi:MAG: hypothetical protein J7J86_08370 [Bacteroidales bacterium]|nr:hypothetical protein [Bacteroidales bacterium]